MDRHVVIVGAGLGGLRAAEQLRAAGHAGPITVIGAEPHLPYNRPPLSKELLSKELLSQELLAPGLLADGRTETGTGELAALHERVAFRRRASVADADFRVGTAVAAADLDGRKLTLADGTTIRFDGLVVATGLRPRRLPVPGPAGPGSGLHVIRTLDDCAALRADLRAALGAANRTASPRVVVVGGGFVGCEVACATRDLGCDVTVIEPAGPPMLRVLGDELASAIQGHHERAGIRFVTGASVLAYTGLAYTGLAHNGLAHNGLAHTGFDQTGLADTGLAHTGLAHTGLAHTGLAHTGPGHAGGQRVTGVVIGDSAEPGGTEPDRTVIGGGPISGGLALAGAVLPADIVVEAVGSVPNTEWLAGTGLDISDGVLTDNGLAAIARTGTSAGASTGTTSTAHPGTLVVAVGDIARFPNPLFDDVPRRVEHWSMPADTARRAAATLVAGLNGTAGATGPFGPIPSFWSDQGELRLQSFGSPALADDIRITEGDPGNPEAGLLAEYYRGGRGVGSVAVNLPPSRQRELRAALTKEVMG